MSEIERYCKMIDRIFNDGFSYPLRVSSKRDMDKSKLLENILEKQSDDRLIVKVNTKDLIESYELVTPQVFLETFCDDLTDAVHDNPYVMEYVSQFDRDKDILDLIIGLPHQIIKSDSTFKGIIIILDDYYLLKSKMPSFDYMYYLFKTILLPNHRNTCYILADDLTFNSNRSFKAKFRHFENDDVLAVKVKRDFELSKTEHLRHDVFLDIDVYGLPVALEILNISDKIDMSNLTDLTLTVEFDPEYIEINLKSDENNLIVINSKENNYLPRTYGFEFS